MRQPGATDPHDVPAPPFDPDRQSLSENGLSNPIEGWSEQTCAVGDRNGALGVADAAATGHPIPGDVRHTPVSWIPPPPIPPGTTSDSLGWPSEEDRFERASLALLSRPSWGTEASEDERFTFPPPVASASSISPIAVGSEEQAASGPTGGLRWTTLLIALAATLGSSALVLALYGAATRSGSSAWGWSWNGMPASTADPLGLPSPAAALESPAAPAMTPREDARRHALEALNQVATNASEMCSRPGFPSASIRVVATFDPNGAVQGAIVETRRGGHSRTARCVGDLVRAAVIPPFEGTPVTVARTVAIP